MSANTIQKRVWEVNDSLLSSHISGTKYFKELRLYISNLGTFSYICKSSEIQPELIDYYYIHVLSINIDLFFHLVPSLCKVDLLDELQLKLERIRTLPRVTKRITELPGDIYVLYTLAATTRLAYYRFYTGIQQNEIRKISFKIAIDYLHKAYKYQASLGDGPDPPESPTEEWFYATMAKVYEKYIEREDKERPIGEERIKYWQSNRDWCYRQLNWLKLQSFFINGNGDYKDD